MTVNFGTRLPKEIVYINPLDAGITVDEMTNGGSYKENLYNSNVESLHDVVCQIGFHIRLNADDYQLGQTVKGLKELRSMVEAYIKENIPKEMTIIGDEPKKALCSSNCTCYCPVEEKY